MKIVARVGAVLSFTFFFLPGVWLAGSSGSERETGVIIFGLILVGVAIFAGTMLWLMGEKLTQTEHR